MSEPKRAAPRRSSAPGAPAGSTDAGSTDASVGWGIPDALIVWLAGLVFSIVVSAPFVDPSHTDRQRVPALLAALMAQSFGVVAAMAVIARRKGLGSLRSDFGLLVRLRDPHVLL